MHNLLSNGENCPKERRSFCADLLQFDFVGWLLGGSSSIWSRIVFTVVGVAAVCGIPGLFAEEPEE